MFSVLCWALFPRHECFTSEGDPRDPPLRYHELVQGSHQPHLLCCAHAATRGCVPPRQSPHLCRLLGTFVPHVVRHNQTDQHSPHTWRTGRGGGEKFVDDGGWAYTQHLLVDLYAYIDDQWQFIENYTAYYITGSHREVWLCIFSHC